MHTCAALARSRRLPARPGRRRPVRRARGDVLGCHPLLAGLVASLIVVMLTVALINEAVERRSRQRWSVLAQYVMLELVRDARLVWTGVAELAGLMPPEAHATEGDVLARRTSIDAGSSAVRDTERLTAGLGELVASAEDRKRLHDKVTIFVEQNDVVLGRWAVCDAECRHVRRGDRPARRAGWRLGVAEQPARVRAHRRGGPGRRKTQPSAALIEGPLDDDQAGRQRLAAITQLAEQLDRETLALALRIVPVAWWREQLGVAPDAES